MQMQLLNNCRFSHFQPGMRRETEYPELCDEGILAEARSRLLS
jgi:hypothetical protein